LDLTTTLASIPLLHPFQASDQLESLAREFYLLVVGKGETVYEVGDQAVCFYIVIEGSVEVRSEATVRVVRAGGDFGAPGQSSVRAETATVKETVRLMALPLTTYESVLQAFVKRQNQSLRVFLASVEAFEMLPRDQLEALVVGAQLRTYTDRTFIVGQGQMVGGISYILYGSVKAIRNIAITANRSETIGIDDLEVGDAVGDLALVTRQPMQYSALSQGRVDCLYLEKALLQGLNKEHWHHLQLTAKPYPPDAALLALHLQQQRWTQHKTSLVLDLKNSQQLRVSRTLEGYRSLPK